jgi:phage terminase large subunit-like protein
MNSKTTNRPTPHKGGLLRRDPGERAVRWINNLTLTDDFAGQPFTLRDWQEWIIRTTYGTLTPDGIRQYSRILLMLPRKQAKTQLSAAIAAYSLLGEGKEGQEIDCAASDRKQASHLFKKVATMIEADRELSRRVKIYYSVKIIETRKGSNVLQVLSADGRRQHGLNPSLLLFDELHTQPNRDLYEALTSAQGTRSEPLEILISTAGNRRDSLCYEEYEYAKKVKAKPSLDPTYLPILYGADMEDDWTAESTWRKAMPALGDFCRIDFIKKKLVKALESPGEESTFKQLYLNLWVTSVTKWLHREQWDECGKHGYTAEELLGLECYGGLDLSSKRDITAFVLVFPLANGTFRVLCHFWLPREEAEKRDRKDGSQKFRNWARQGWITLTDGDVIDYEEVKATIRDYYKDYRIKKIRADQYSCTQIALQLQAEGIDMEFMRQGTISMNEPVAALEVLIARDLLHHGDNPVLNWMADNAVTERDGHGNVKLSKGKSADKIDGMVSLAMGMAGAMFDQHVTPSYIKT